MLAGGAPILVFMFPKVAETIVYVPFPFSVFKTHGFDRQNNSIRDMTLLALATPNGHSHPRPIEVLEMASEDVGVMQLMTARMLSRLEDNMANIIPRHPCLPQYPGWKRLRLGCDLVYTNSAQSGRPHPMKPYLDGASKVR